MYFKKIIPWLFSFIILFFILNLISIWFIKFNYNANILEKNTYQIEKRKYIKNFSKSSVPHPFFGNMVLSDTFFNSDFSSEPMFTRISSFGSKKPIKVLILGGSMAEHFSNRGLNYDQDIFFEQINKYFKTDRFEIYNAAFGGGKQPQQFFKLVYLDFLGFKPDIVINIDGFNEIVLPIHDNTAINNPPIYPRSYSLHINATSNDRRCAKNNNILINKNYFLPLIELYVWSYITSCHKKIIGKQNQWWTDMIKKKYWFKHEDYPEISKKIWIRASNQMQDFLNYKNITYLHILQPNQYLENSKSFSELEKKEFINFKPYGDILKNNYLKLDFKDTNVKNFLDLRYVFLDEKQTVYADDCCHLNKYGMSTIFRKIFVKFENDFLKLLSQ